MRDISDEAQPSSRAQVPAAQRVAAATGRMLRRDSSPMNLHRQRRRSLPPACRRSQRGPRDFYHGLLARISHQVASRGT